MIKLLQRLTKSIYCYLSVEQLSATTTGDKIMKTYDIETSLLIMSIMSDISSVKKAITAYRKLNAFDFLSAPKSLNLKTTALGIFAHRNKSCFLNSCKVTILALENDLSIQKKRTIKLKIEAQPEYPNITGEDILADFLAL